MRKYLFLSYLLFLGVIYGNAQLLPYNDSLRISPKNMEEKKDFDLWINPKINVPSLGDVRESYLIQTGLCAAGLFLSMTIEKT